MFGREPDTGIRLITLFKLAKGFLLLAIGLEGATLLRGDVAATLKDWAHVLWIARESRYVQDLLFKLASLDHTMLVAAEISTLIYSALLLTEGVGLLLLKRWAEYLTVVITASFIPLELFTLERNFSVERMIVLVMNIAVVWYLLRILWRERK
jgi:uncharacterized membrane protein (DUF2068 family)